MKQLHTDILIDAPAQKIWDILMDFDKYPEWNPFIRSVHGSARPGSKLRIKLQPPGSRGLSISPTCLVSSENSEFRWLGHLIIPGLFDGEHIFKLTPLSDRSTRFVQSENFKGLLVPLLWKQLDTSTRAGFILMNESLKARAETI